MYEFHYKYNKRKYDTKLLFNETDSLVYEMEIKNVYEDFYENKSLFDFRDYPQDTRFFDPVSKNVIGKSKDKFKGRIVSELVELKSKMYSLVDVYDEENQKAKVVNKNVAKT